MVLCNRNMSWLKCVYNQKYIFRGGDGLTVWFNYHARMLKYRLHCSSLLSSQNRFSVCVWARIMDDYILTYVMQDRLGGVQFADFLGECAFTGARGHVFSTRQCLLWMSSAQLFWQLPFKYGLGVMEVRSPGFHVLPVWPPLLLLPLALQPFVGFGFLIQVIPNFSIRC
jgi:hypothetical protein